MGCCASSNGETTEPTTTVNDNQDVKKLLFLGPGGCGKSTLFKQLRQIFGSTIEENERRVYAGYISSFVIETVSTVLARIEDKSQLSSKAQEASNFISTLDSKTPIDDEITAHIKTLWSEPFFKQTFEEEAKLKLFHSCAHFLDEIDKIGNKDYIPTDMDILLQRRPTTGLIQEKMCVNETWLQIFDVGGQKNERRKWIHQFENVSAVVFVASLSSFDEPMFDDERINSLQDSIELFKEICNSPYFVHQHMILVLNKQDLLQDKLTAGKRLKDYPTTSDYAGADDDLQACIKFIESKFRGSFARSLEELKKSPQQETATAAQSRLLFVRITCAYQAENVKNIFSDVQGILTGKITTNES